MHRIVNLQSTGYDASVIAGHKDTIRSKLDGYADYLYASQVNDGTDESGNPTLAVNADFDDATQANSFHSELVTYIKDNAGDFQQARTRVHDCMHAADKNEPCQIGDVWAL